MRPPRGSGDGRKKRESIPRTRGHAPPRRSGNDATGPQRPGYRHRPPKRSSEGAGGAIMTVFLFLIAISLAAGMIMVMIPKKLDYIQGYPAQATDEASDNLLIKLQTVLTPTEKDIILTEAEVNAYLNKRLKGRQGGPVSAFVKFKGVYADFEPGNVEIFMERSIFGLPFIVSLDLEKRKLKQTSFVAGGGRIGSFAMGTRQFKPIVDAFLRMAVALSEEIQLTKRMASIEFEKDRVVLKPPS